MDRWLWERVQAALFEALSRDPDERAQFVAAIADGEIRSEVESLLAADAGAMEARVEKAVSGAARHLIHGGNAQPDSLITNRYRLLELLGAGGMSEVYAGEDLQLGRKVALKLLPHAFSGDPGRVRRFEQEARALSALNHPNILTVFEIGNVDERWFIAMEYVQGEPLSARIGRGALPAAEALAIAGQIATGLAAAHQHGILHRDIKPANIMVRDDGLVKLVDFGLAHVERAQQSPHEPPSLSGAVLGTPSYMSPEQARGQPLDARSDLWSLGAVLFEMVTGSKAFDGDSTPDILVAVLEREPAIASTKAPFVSPAVDELILRLLSKDRSDRPASAAEVVEEVRQIGSGLARQPLSKWWRTAGKAGHAVGRLIRNGKPSRWWAASALLTAAAILFAWMWFRGGGPAMDLRIRPLTAQSGWESFPALSPDGESVAFCWTDNQDRPRQIYVKRTGGEGLQRLTDSGSDGLIGPLVWSPDGSEIMFTRWEGGSRPGAIYRIPRSGGPPTRVTPLRRTDLTSTIDWSPDGRYLAYADVAPGTSRLSIFLLDLRSGEKRQLTTAPAGHWGDWSPTFSGDGRTIAFKRVTSYWLDEIYLAAVADGRIRQVTRDRRGIWGHAWMSGADLVLSCQRSGSVFGLWQIPLRSPDGGRSLAAVGADAITPAVARKANRLAWVNQVEDVDLYRIATSGAGGPTRWIRSTLRDLGPDYAPDGRIAFTSDRSGSTEVWIGRGDGSQQVRVTRFGGPALGSPRWSPDGRRLAIHAQPYGRSMIYVMDCEAQELRCGEPKQVGGSNAGQLLSGWSADGKFLYIASDRTGRWEAWKQPIEGGAPVQASRHGAVYTYESPDGKWLYFSKGGSADRNTIWRRPGQQDGRDMGKEELLIGVDQDVAHEGWRVTGKEIYFVSRSPSRTSETLRAYDLASGGTRSILNLDNLPPERAVTQLSVSPDSAWMLFSRADRSGSNVMIADFQPAGDGR